MKRKLIFFIAFFCISIGIMVSFDVYSARAEGYKDRTRNEYGYSSLDDTGKKLFDLLGEEIESFIISERYKTDLDAETADIILEFTLEEGESLSKKELNTAVTRFIYSNPGFYWLKNGYTYGYIGNQYKISLKVDPYYYSYQVRKSTDEAINSLSGSWVALVKAEAEKKDDFYAALLAHDLIIRNIDYSRDSSGTPETGVWAHTIAGVFTGDGAVCEGYSKAFEYILDLAGIPNIYITGTGGNEAHAWNAVKYNDKWYLCDITWDDPNEKTEAGFLDSDYTYFFMPVSVFSKKHTPSKDPEDYLYELPDFADEMDSSFYGKFKCYSDATVFTEDTGAQFADQVLANRYYNSDFIFMAFKKEATESAVKYVVPKLVTETKDNYSFQITDLGYILKLNAPVIETPAVSIELDKDTLSLEISDSATVTASIPDGSDDRILWTVSLSDDKTTFPPSRFIKLSVNGNKATIEGLKNGKVILTATTYSSASSDNPIAKSCIITVGTGESGADYVLWQNGAKEYKKIKLNTKLKATEWKDDKGKVKKGKLVWFVSDSAIVPEFGYSKRNVTFSSAKSKKASVNGKGEVTAKQAGTVYIYACDTGSMTYEEFMVDILAAPTKLYITEVAGSTDKEDIVKKYCIEAGDSDYLYISPFVKDGKADVNCSYTVRIAKEDQKKYASVGEVQLDDKGNPFFWINALDFDQTKNKTASVKIEVLCTESNKKASMNLVVCNPVSKAQLITSVSGDASLSSKKDSVTYTLDLTTALKDAKRTTDKIKIYVGKTSVTLDPDNKVIADKGATVRAKFDQKTMSLTLTASKDAGTPAVIAAVFTNPISKDSILIELARVDETGLIKLGKS